MSEVPQHRLGEVERKMLTLYALRELGGCGHLQLIRFMVENDIMNYFDLQRALYDLRDAGQAARTDLAADELYQITPAGEEALALFLQRVPQSLLTKAEQAVPGFRARFHQERERSARILHEGQEEYKVRMEIVEQGTALLGIDLVVPTAELAARFRDRWSAHAQEIYDHIISRLAKEDEA